MSNEFVGTVKWFNDEKGYGFIQYDGGDVFVHFKAIQNAQGRKTLKENQQVSFELAKSDKGLKAENVNIIS